MSHLFSFTLNGPTRATCLASIKHLFTELAQGPVELGLWESPFNFAHMLFQLDLIVDRSLQQS